MGCFQVIRSQSLQQEDDLYYVVHNTQIMMAENKPEVHDYKKILDNSNIKFKNLVFRQAILETNWFKSDIYLECKNPHGMKRARIRKTTSVGTCRGHARYNSIEDAVKDYELWQSFSMNMYEKKYNQIKTEEQYLTFLLRVGYAEDRKYINKLRKIIL